jgi:hypothetical protein
MTIVDVSELDVLNDEDAPTIERVIAAKHLARSDAIVVLDALLCVARDEQAPEWLAFAAGESIAAILMRRSVPTEALLADFTGPAYLGFDETVASYEWPSSNGER